MTALRLAHAAAFAIALVEDAPRCVWCGAPPVGRCQECGEPFCTGTGCGEQAGVVHRVKEGA